MRKVFNGMITVLALAGVVTIIGGVGTADYMVELGQEYSTFEMLKMMLLGVLMILPAIVREVC